VFSFTEVHQFVFHEITEVTHNTFAHNQVSLCLTIKNRKSSRLHGYETLYQSVWCHIPEELSHQHHCENFSIHLFHLYAINSINEQHKVNVAKQSEPNKGRVVNFIRHLTDTSELVLGC